MTESAAAQPANADAAACSLAPDALAHRIGEWQSLAARALHHTVVNGELRATYPNTPDVVRRLEELIEAEQQCCSFFEFHLQARGQVLEVDLRFPQQFTATAVEIWGR